MEELEKLEKKYGIIRPYLNEASMRVCAAADALIIGRGGPSIVARASGLSRTTIYAGMKEINEKAGVEEIHDTNTKHTRIRHKGGGRKCLVTNNPELLTALVKLVSPLTRGDPTSPLRWTCKSTTKLAEELRKQGFKICQRTVWTLLDEMGYSMQSNRKTREGADHPDRNKQFLYIAQKVEEFQKANLPVISVDAKKKENIGCYKNAGREWQPSKQPEEVNMHDFTDKELGKVIPYGVYDLTQNHGWVSVGINHNTAEFAVATIHRWWKEMGMNVYPGASELLITADGGGSNGSRVRLWKMEIQRLAREENMTIQVCHFPPGTSKWNKIEHRMFCHITANWRGRPLESTAIVVNLIANTHTKQGLKIKADVDSGLSQSSGF